MLKLSTAKERVFFALASLLCPLLTERAIPDSSQLQPAGIPLALSRIMLTCSPCQGRDLGFSALFFISNGHCRDVWEKFGLGFCLFCLYLWSCKRKEFFFAFEANQFSIVLCPPLYLDYLDFFLFSDLLLESPIQAESGKKVIFSLFGNEVGKMYFSWCRKTALVEVFELPLSSLNGLILVRVVNKLGLCSYLITET